VPVAFAVWDVDDIAGMELDNVLAVHLDQAPPRGDIKGLAALVGVPGAPGAGAEMHGGDVQLRPGQAPGDRVDPGVAGKGFGGPFRPRRLRRNVYGRCPFGMSAPAGGGLEGRGYPAVVGGVEGDAECHDGVDGVEHVVG
jgi:hypothetical protein